MILTQYVIDRIKDGSFNIEKFVNEIVPGNTLTFLYPHPIKTGIEIKDFNFKRNDLIWILKYLK